MYEWIVSFWSALLALLKFQCFNELFLHSTFPFKDNFLSYECWKEKFAVYVILHEIFYV